MSGGYGVFPPEIEYKNALINPDFQIAQEGNSFATMSSGDYIMDGWKYYKSGAMVHTGSQDTDVPTVAESGSLSKTSLKLDCTTIDSSIAAGDYCYIAQPIEGYRALPVLQQSFTLRFLHKHTKTGTYCVALRNSGSDRSYVAEYTQSTTDTWEMATINVDASPTGGTWDYTNGTGLEVCWTVSGGSTYQTSAGSWATGNYLATSSQVNACDSTSNNFRLSKAWLYPGTDDVDFMMPDYDDQLIECKRYFEKSYPIDSDPGTAATKDSHFSLMFDTNYATHDSVNFTVEKRSDASVTIYNTQDGTSGQYSIYNLAGTHQSNQTGSKFDAGRKGFKISLSGNGVADQLMRLHYTADSRL